MDAALVTESGTKPLIRTIPEVTKEPTAKYATIQLTSRWDADAAELFDACPDPAPEGFMFRPEYRDVTEKRGGKDVVIRHLFLTPVPAAPKPVKPGVVDVSAMSDDQLRTYCAEHDIDTGERPGKPLRKDQLLAIIQKAGK